MKRNPPQWLPPDFGAFAHLRKNRTCKVTGTKTYAITLPDGTKLQALRKLGRGHATFAVGKDTLPWAYLVTNGKVDDPAKDIMAAVTENVLATYGENLPAWSHHLPWVEFVGTMSADSVFKGTVHRAPLYLFLDETSTGQYPKLKKIIKNLDKYAAGRKDPVPVLNALLTRPDVVPTPIVEAVLVVWQQARKLYPRRQFVLEFPPANLALDHQDVLVLADIIFDAASVQGAYGELFSSSGRAAVRKRHPSPGARKPASKRPAAKKAAAPKPAAKKAATRKPAAKKPAKRRSGYGWFPTTSDVLGPRKKRR